MTNCVWEAEYDTNANEFNKTFNKILEDYLNI